MNRTTLTASATAILLALALCAPTQAASQPTNSHLSGPRFVVVRVTIAPYVAPPATIRPMDNPNYAYNIAAPRLNWHTTTAQDLTFSWCNHGIPAPYAKLVDVSLNQTQAAPLDVVPNACETEEITAIQLQPGHLYNSSEYEAYHGNSGPITPWIQ